MRLHYFVLISSCIQAYVRTTPSNHLARDEQPPNLESLTSDLWDTSRKDAQFKPLKTSRRHDETNSHTSLLLTQIADLTKSLDEFKTITASQHDSLTGSLESLQQGFCLSRERGTVDSNAHILKRFLGQYYVGQSTAADGSTTHRMVDQDNQVAEVTFDTLLKTIEVEQSRLSNSHQQRRGLLDDISRFEMSIQGTMATALFLSPFDSCPNQLEVSTRAHDKIESIFYELGPNDFVKIITADTQEYIFTYDPEKRTLSSVDHVIPSQLSLCFLTVFRIGRALFDTMERTTVGLGDFGISKSTLEDPHSFRRNLLIQTLND